MRMDRCPYVQFPWPCNSADRGQTRAFITKDTERHLISVVHAILHQAHWDRELSSLRRDWIVAQWGSLATDLNRVK
jgi:hypothetical protein